MTRKPSVSRLSAGLERLARETEMKLAKMRELDRPELDEAVRAVNSAAAALAGAASSLRKTK